MNYRRIAERLKPTPRHVLLRHVDALSSIFGEPFEPRAHIVGLATNHLIALGLLRECNRDDGPPHPRRTILTNDGRLTLAALIGLLDDESLLEDEAREVSETKDFYKAGQLILV